MTAPAIVWRPDADLLRESNVARFMAAEGVADFPTLLQRSIDEPEWFWDAVVRFLGIRFSRPYERVLDDSARHPVGEVVRRRSLQCATCVDRCAYDHLDLRATPPSSGRARRARSRTLTWAELRTLTDQIASGPGRSRA